MAPGRKIHIPVGSVVISREETDLSQEIWSSEGLKNWNSFIVDEGDLPRNNLPKYWLHPCVQEALFNSHPLKGWKPLFMSKWIKLEFKAHPDGSQFGTIRVYFLPDDLSRRQVNRDPPKFKLVRQRILNGLDYSNEAWNGNTTSRQSASPVLCESADFIPDEQNVSLLWLFNNIPSPTPNTDLAFEAHTRNVMFDLLESNVSGLLSKLYPYQRRSAALMLQKEAAPQKILDPRFMHVRDQTGDEWYFDPVEGNLLKDPRFYDGVSGGILAEEMGAGKTIICLALILATKDLPSQAPEIFRCGEIPVRKRIASLADMAASCATRNGVPWKPYFKLYERQLGEDYANCVEALNRHPPHYLELPPFEPRILRRSSNSRTPREIPLQKILLSSGSLVIVPNNLVAQWRQEIAKHTEGLKVLVVTKGVEIPAAEVLVEQDLILFSQTRFETIGKEFFGWHTSPLFLVHFKRCIVDEGHKLGNSKISRKSNFLVLLDSLRVSSRWIVTGTPSHGLFGVDLQKAKGDDQPASKVEDTKPGKNDSLLEMEKKDLERIGSITMLYLKVRPWANNFHEAGDIPADWSVYLMLPRHSPKGRGRADCLRSTLNSLIIRHQLSEVGTLLPPVEHRVVLLDGSYQDQLSLNIFSMMIIFNSVQSQRTDMDYFFHPRQRKALLEIVHNLKQATFFGGSFFSYEDISKSVQTAEDFLRDRKITISKEDEDLLRQAIDIGHTAMANKLKGLSNYFHEMPITVQGLPAGAAESWSIDAIAGNGSCTSPSMLLALQKLVYKAMADPGALNSLLNGGLIQEGLDEREKMISAQLDEKNNSSTSKTTKSPTLAGNTRLGEDSPHRKRSHGVNGIKPTETTSTDASLGPLEQTKIISTVSSKLSYLIDSIIKHQDEEKIIIFYENDNVAWYLASMLDVLQIQHLIYAKGLTAERRAHYVVTFNNNPTFRVLLMDLSQAAFGLDIREASRVYFINPVLNPQVEAQAIGRVRRISQQKPVSVETLVLKNSLEEVILERKKHMTQAEHRQVKSILDVGSIYDWIKSARIIPLPEGGLDSIAQMTSLRVPQNVFGRGFGRSMHPDDGIIMEEAAPTRNGVVGMSKSAEMTNGNGLKRQHEAGPGRAEAEGEPESGQPPQTSDKRELATRPARRVRFTVDSDEE